MPDGTDNSRARDYKSCEVNDLVSLCLDEDNDALDELVLRGWDAVTPTQLVAICLTGFVEALDELVSRDWAGVTDSDLVSLWLGGYPVAFDPLVRRYWKRVFYVVRAVLNDPARAQELAQDTFVKASRSGDTFKPGSSFWPWLRKSAYYRALSEKAHIGTRPGEEPLPQGFDPSNMARDWVTPTTREQLAIAPPPLTPDAVQQRIEAPTNPGAGRLRADAEADAEANALAAIAHRAEDAALRQWKQFVLDYRRHEDRWIDQWLSEPRLSDVRNALQMLLNGYGRAAIVDANVYTSEEAVRTGLDRAVKNVLTASPKSFQIARRIVDDLTKAHRDLALLGDEKILFLTFFDLDRIRNHG